MKINRTSIAAGLTVGVLAGGAGGAIAATTSGAATASTSSTPTSMATDGSDGYGYGRGGGDWQNRGTGVGWSGVDSDIGGTRWTSFAQPGRQAAQTYLGLSASQLSSRLQSGRTLAEIASNQGKSVAGLESAIETAVSNSVNADRALSAGQKSSTIANLTSSVDSVVTGASDGVAGPWHGGPDAPMASGGW
jgi:hypothetical protein